MYLSPRPVRLSPGGCHSHLCPGDTCSVHTFPSRDPAHTARPGAPVPPGLSQVRPRRGQSLLPAPSAVCFNLSFFCGDSSTRHELSASLLFLSPLPAASKRYCPCPSRQELVVALSHLVVQYESNFCTVALQFMEEEKNYPLPSPATTGTACSARGLSSPLPGGAGAGRWQGPRDSRCPGHLAE